MGKPWLKCFILLWVVFTSFSGCKLNDNSLIGQVGLPSEDGASTPPPPVYDRLKFTGDSDISTPITTRVIDVYGASGWTFEGECDIELGDVTISLFNPNGGGQGTTPCNTVGGGTFSIEVLPNFGPGLLFNQTYRVWNKVTIVQGSNSATTQIFQYTVTPPIQITSKNELKETGSGGLLACDSTSSTKTFFIMNDIDMSEGGSNPTDNWVSPCQGFGNGFQGHIIGNGYTIRNLDQSSGGSSFQGLIGVLESGGSITDLYLDSANVAGTSYVGVAVGLIDFGHSNNIHVTNSTVSGTGNFVGGIIGLFDAGCGRDLSFQGNVTTIGNSVGSITGGYLENDCLGYVQANASVGGNNYVGGLVGDLSSADSAGTIFDSYFLGTVTGAQFVGGLVGRNSDDDTLANIIRSYAIADVTASDSDGGPAEGSSSGGLTENVFYQSTGKTCSGCGHITGTSLTNLEMQTQSKFSNYDFNSIWQIDTGSSPTLKSDIFKSP